MVPNTVRSRIDHASLPLMTKLTELPRPVPFLILLGLLVGGLFSGTVLGLAALGFVLMAVAAGFVGWVLYLSWPRLTGSERIMRLSVFLLAVAMAVVQLFPRT